MEICDLFNIDRTIYFLESKRLPTGCFLSFILNVFYLTYNHIDFYFYIYAPFLNLLQCPFHSKIYSLFCFKYSIYKVHFSFRTEPFIFHNLLGAHPRERLILTLSAVISCLYFILGKILWDFLFNVSMSIDIIFMICLCTMF